MPRLIKHGALVDDRWTLRRDVSSLVDLAGIGPVIVPLALWLAHQRRLARPG